MIERDALLELKSRIEYKIEVGDLEEIREMLEGSYYEFFKYFWRVLNPGRVLKDNWHIKYLCDEIQEVGERVIRREPYPYNLLVNISPGESKSSILTIFFPVWLWVRDPSLEILTISNGQTLVNKLTLKSRTLIKSPKFQKVFGHRFKLRRDMDAISYYGVMYGPNFDKPGGNRSAAGVDGSVTGDHFDIIICDDLMKPKDAGSEVVMEKSNNFLDDTLNSRKNDANVTPTICCMQRICVGDPSEHLEDKWRRSGTLRHIKLPIDNRYEIHPPELEKKYKKDGRLRVMNPIRRPAKIIKKIEAETSSSAFAAQYGEAPSEAVGGVFEKAWFSGRFSVQELEQRARRIGKTIVWNSVFDGAFTDKKKKNAASAMLVYTVFEGKLYLRSHFEEWLKFPDLVRQVPSFCFAHGFHNIQSTIYAEPKASGIPLVQYLQEKGGINIVMGKVPTESKELRADLIQPFCRGRNVLLNQDWDWTVFLKRLGAFPNSKLKDLVDCLGMAVNMVDQFEPWEGWKRLA